MSPPPKLPRVCVGPSTLPEDLAQGRFNISWEPLPCHLQNGADISGYTIQYSPLPNGVVTTISHHHTSFLCGLESGDPYSCWVANSLFRPNQTYSFQVAARNSHGEGSFSDPVSVESVPIPISQGIVANNHSCCYMHNSLVYFVIDSSCTSSI